MDIRPVVAGEHERLRSLRLEALAADPAAFGSTHEREVALPARWWVDWAQESEVGAVQRTFVAVAADGAWAGLALARLAEAPATALLHAMWVAPRARAQGVSRALCDACAAWAAERGCRELVLGVVAGNDDARRAYEAAGFVGREHATVEHHGRVTEELVMARPLARADSL